VVLPARVFLWRCRFTCLHATLLPFPHLMCDACLAHEDLLSELQINTVHMYFLQKLLFPERNNRAADITCRSMIVEISH
jgi:hypothetical protein